jgi:hypothetical protein
MSLYSPDLIGGPFRHLNVRSEWIPDQVGETGPYFDIKPGSTARSLDVTRL